MIMYGQQGEEAQPIKADRPGNTFAPFARLLMKAMSTSVGIPYAVGFLDTDGVSFAGYRSAMLEAWRTYTFHRAFLGLGPLQKIWTMLQEEAFLKGDLGDVPDFYTNMAALTRVQWRGYPKGDIEPLKAIQADILAIQNNLKTREDSIIERGGEINHTFHQLTEEQNEMAQGGLYDGPVLKVSGETAAQSAASEGKQSADPSKPEGTAEPPAAPSTVKGPAAKPPATPATPGETEEATADRLFYLQSRVEEMWDEIEQLKQESRL